MPDLELADLVRRLVAVDSVNPAFGGPGEGPIAELVAHWCERAGLTVEVQEAAQGRPNVVARSGASGPSLLLNAHMDTVGTVGMQEPFAGRIDDSRLHGRGAYDMKGSLAVAMLAAADAAREGLNVIVAAVADEELGSVGTEALVRTVQADAAVVLEPTDEGVAVAHKGFAGFEIETRGVAAHGSRPDLGVDAIALMGPVLVRLRELAGRLEAAEPDPLLGTPSVHASLIEGGQEYSSYPERCLLTAERRVLPGEGRADVEREARELTAGDAGVEVRLGLSRDPFAVAETEPVVQAVLRHAGTRIRGVPFWTDAALLADAGIPTVVYGPAGDGAHAVVEWVDLDSLARVRATLLGAARDLRGSA